MVPLPPQSSLQEPQLVKKKKESVEQLVIETRASRMQSERSTTELQPLKFR